MSHLLHQVIAKLLECRASPNGPVAGGIGTTHPLSLLSINATSNPYAVEAARLLVKATANVNQQCKVRENQGPLVKRDGLRDGLGRLGK